MHDLSEMPSLDPQAHPGDPKMSWHAEQPGQAEPQATPRRAVGAWYPRLIILCGVAYTTFFIAQLRDEVFYSGDGGLKALLVQQLSRGEFTDALKLPAEPWVRLLWVPVVFDVEETLIKLSGDGKAEL